MLCLVAGGTKGDNLLREPGGHEPGMEAGLEIGGDQNMRPNQNPKRIFPIRSIGIAILFTILAASALAQGLRDSNPPRETQASASVIHIKFADSQIPEIDVSGREATVAEPYGVYDTAAEHEAKAHVAAEMPPPDLSQYELQWDTHEQMDAQKLDYLSSTVRDTLTNRPFDYSDPYAGYSDYANFGNGGYRVVPDDLVQRHRVLDYQPTAPDHYPRYNQTQYNADLAQWRRDQERAAMRGLERPRQSSPKALHRTAPAVPRRVTPSYSGPRQPRPGPAQPLTMRGR